MKKKKKSSIRTINRLLCIFLFLIGSTIVYVTTALSLQAPITPTVSVFPEYTIEELEDTSSQGNYSTGALRVSDFGWAYGHSSVPGNCRTNLTCTDAVVWINPTTPVTIGRLPGDFSAAATALNQNGNVGMDSWHPTTASKPALFYSAVNQIVQLPTLGTSPRGQVLGLNDNDIAVGFSNIWVGRLLPKRAVYWVNGQVNSLHPSSNYDESWASGINNQGNIVGSSGKRVFHVVITSASYWSLDSAGNYVHSTLSHPSSCAGGFISSQAEKILESGKILGSCSDYTVVWDSNLVPKEIDIVPNYQDGARDMNESEYIVGEYIDFLLRKRISYVYHQSFGMIDLNSFVPQGSGWSLDQVSGINSQGQITGAGELNGMRKGFLLTPR